MSPAKGSGKLIYSEAELTSDQMKCLGSDNPPCARCAKAGRECIVQRPARTNYSSGAITPSSHARVNSSASHLRAEERLPTSSTQDELPLPGHNHNFSPINSNVPVTNEPALPSIYTTPPYSTVFNQPDGSPNHGTEGQDSRRSWKRRRIGSVGQSPLSLPPADLSNSPIPKRDIIQYIDM